MVLERGRLVARARRLAHRVELRVRANAALAVAGAGLPLVLLATFTTLGIVKMCRPDGAVERVAALVPAVAALALFACSTRSFMRRLPPLHGALLLDRRYGLMSRLTTVLSLAPKAPEHVTPMEELAIEDGLTIDFDGLRPRAACPIRRPPELWLSVGLLVALAGLAVLEVRTTRIVPVPAELVPLLVTADDLDLFRQWSDQLSRESQGTATQAGVRRMGRLVEDLAERRLGRREALRRIAALEQSVIAAGEADREALDAALDRLARELASSSLTKPAADALDARRLEDAAAALQQLAETLKQKRAPSPAELERLRKALERAGNSEKANRDRLAAAQGEVERRRKSLLQKKNKGGLGPAEERELESLERQHRRLERDRSAAAAGEQPMTELEKQLAQAARELMKDLGRSAEDLEAASDAMRGVAQRRLNEQEQRELLERLRQLREVVRQQGQGGEQLRERLTRFGKHARGEKASADARGQPGNGQGDAGKKPGAAAGLAMSRGTAQLRVPMPGGPGKSESRAEGDSAGTDTRASGREWGTGEGPDVRGKQTEPAGEVHDTSAVAADTGQGSASSEVIQGAAERGFVGRDYRDVYAAYEGVAEHALEADEIPAGYRLYVRRYFQLIRPRE